MATGTHAVLDKTSPLATSWNATVFADVSFIQFAYAQEVKQNILPFKQKRPFFLRLD